MIFWTTHINKSLLLVSIEIGAWLMHPAVNGLQQDSSGILPVFACAWHWLGESEHKELSMEWFRLHRNGETSLRKLYLNLCVMKVWQNFLNWQWKNKILIFYQNYINKSLRWGSKEAVSFPYPGKLDGAVLCKTWHAPTTKGAELKNSYRAHKLPALTKVRRT